MFYAGLCTPDIPARDNKLKLLLPLEFLRRPGKKYAHSDKGSPDFYLDLMTPYQRVLAVTDYVSGMTDSFAVNLYQRLSGIKLPG